MSSGAVAHQQQHDLRAGLGFKLGQLRFERGALRATQRARLVDDPRRQRRYRQQVLRPHRRVQARSEQQRSERSQQGDYLEAAAAAGFSKLTEGGAVIAASLATARLGLTP